MDNNAVASRLVRGEPRSFSTAVVEQAGMFVCIWPQQQILQEISSLQLAQ